MSLTMSQLGPLAEVRGITVRELIRELLANSGTGSGVHVLDVES